jgi:hypothetical protein
MSLILDALKKIEQDKRRAAGGSSELVAMSRPGIGGRHQLLSMGAIALGSALLAAAAVSFLNGRETGAGSVSDGSSPALSAPSTDAPEPELPDAEAPQLVPPAPIATRSESAAAESSTERPAKPEATSSGVRAAEIAEPVVEPVEPVEGSPDDEDAVTQPIRLVGQERILLDALNIGQQSESTEQSSENLEPPPDDLAKLVLQGTSVIGGNAVAVISDQRVFEGDRVEGALVVRIGEREVELEVDGKRFKLRL